MTRTAPLIIAGTGTASCSAIMSWSGRAFPPIPPSAATTTRRSVSIASGPPEHRGVNHESIPTSFIQGIQPGGIARGDGDHRRSDLPVTARDGQGAAASQQHRLQIQSSPVRRDAADVRQLQSRLALPDRVGDERAARAALAHVCLHASGMEPHVLLCPDDPATKEEHSFLLNHHLADRGVRYGRSPGISADRVVVMGEKVSTAPDYYMEAAHGDSGILRRRRALPARRGAGLELSLSRSAR